MGQSLSRRQPVPTTTPTTPASAPAPGPGNSNVTHHPHRRSLPHRILSSIPKPSLRSRLSSNSPALPLRPEQTLRGKNRRWRLSRRHNAHANTEGTVPEHMAPLTEHDEHQVDRDVDEFGVITHRVPDNHSDSPATPAKGKEKAKDIFDVEDDNEDNDNISAPSTSTTPPSVQSGANKGHHSDDEVVIAPTAPPSPRQPTPLPPEQQSERRSVALPSAPTPPPPSPPQATTQQANSSPRPFPPPGTLVVVQGVVHTTDAPRSSDRLITNPIPSMTRDVLHSNTNTNFDPTPRPSSLPPETRSRNPLSGILARPASMVPAVPSPPEPMTGSSNVDPQARQTTSIADGPVEDSEDEDRAHTNPHGISIAQGPTGASGLSASSIDVLGTLLSVAAAATAASLLTGSSEPIFSSGLTPQPTMPQPTGFNPNVPSERPLSPTPTSDAGRMRHVWSSLRDRLGLGSGAHNLNHSNDTAASLGPGQTAPSQPSEVVRPRDPREIMLAEMARAFNLGLGLGGATANTQSATPSANPNSTELPISDDGDILAGERNGEQSTLPPPDSFERFLMDLQTDLRVTLMQGQDTGASGEAPQDAAVDVEEDQPIPELQSLSDSDSEEFETGHFESDDEDQLGCEDDMDNMADEEDAHTAQEQLSGRTSPAVSGLSSGAHYPLGMRIRRGSPSLSSSGRFTPHTASSQSISTAISRDINGEIGANSSAVDNGKSGDSSAARGSPIVSTGIGTLVPADGASSSEMGSDQHSEGEEEGAVLGVAHSREASIRGRSVAEGWPAVSRSIAVQPPDTQDPSNVSGTKTRQDSFPLGTSSSSGPSTSNTPNSFPGAPELSSLPPTQLSPSTLPPSLDRGPIAQSQPSPNSTTGDSPMPFRLPFTPSSASRTEHTPGGGINWWRMYRFPAIASPSLGQGGAQGSSLSQPAFRAPAQGPSHPSSWARTPDQQNEMMTSRGGVTQVPGVRSGLAQPALTPSAATPANMPEIVPPSNPSNTTPPSIGQDLNPLANPNSNSPEHRNIVVPVIVVGLQSVNMDRQPPHMPHPHANHTSIEDEDGDGLEFDGLEQPMSVPLHIPEPPEIRHHSSPSNATQQEQSGQQPARGRTWQSRAANAIRNLRPLRRNPDTTSPPRQDTPGSRTFLIYVIGGYYPPDHQIITGGNLDSFEALWELAELLGQVKPPTVSKEEIEKSGLEIINASMLEDYEEQGRVASNCVERCLICLDDYIPEDELRVLTCKHTFHQGCVDRWLETGRNNCPACRTKGVNNENTGPTPATLLDRPLHGI